MYKMCLRCDARRMKKKSLIEFFPPKKGKKYFSRQETIFVFCLGEKYI